MKLKNQRQKKKIVVYSALFFILIIIALIDGFFNANNTGFMDEYTVLKSIFNIIIDFAIIIYSVHNIFCLFKSNIMIDANKIRYFSAFHITQSTVEFSDIDYISYCRNDKYDYMMFYKDSIVISVYGYNGKRLAGFAINDIDFDSFKKDYNVSVKLQNDEMFE